MTELVTKSRWEYALMANSGTTRTLLTRLITGMEDETPPWRPIATFGSYNDAERILAILEEEQIRLISQWAAGDRR